MYGMVNRAIKDLVVATTDLPTWNSICSEAGLAQTDFTDTVVYDDAVTFDLVTAASKVLGRTPESILEGFGRHWILFTGREGWGPLFDMAGHDLRSFLAGLDDLHARVQTSMPAIRVPSFTVVSADDESMTVEYRSERDGLAPMVTGLLAGLTEHFGEQWTIQHTGLRSDLGYDTFSLTPVLTGNAAKQTLGTS